MNFLKLSEVVIPPSQYWTIVYGRAPGEVKQDAEGMQTVSRNARSLAWLLKTLDAGRSDIKPPSPQERIYTHFVR
jgi:hypothetical protein